MPVPTSPRDIPAIEQLRQRDDTHALERRFGREAVVDALRAEAAALRAELGADPGAAVDPRSDAPAPTPGARAEAAATILERATARLESTLAPSLRPVINATGVIVHTNMGRAPLGRTAIERVALVAGGYTNLEYDLARGSRGRRDVHAEALLTRLTGAEAAVVVNNNAAATLLVLTALARGREVIISRGELVEIGGGFRVPDVMAQSGATLREVGTTNRTRLADYAAAISEKTALVLRVHRSNFRIEGFTERPDVAGLAALAHEHRLPLADDLGSGHLRVAGGPGDAVALRDEPDVRQALAQGADVVCFSGDKLLGGPQAGIVAGRRDLVDRIRHHPLMRALRVDKLTYAALEGTLVEWAAGRAAVAVPVAKMIAVEPDALAERAERFARTLAASTTGLRAWTEPGASTIGGGSAPGSELPTTLVVLEKPGCAADALEQRLRALPVPIIARIERDRVVLDLRTVDENDEDRLLDQIRQL